MRRLRCLAVLPLLGPAACAWGDWNDASFYGRGDRYGTYAYQGERWRPHRRGPGPYAGELRGPGVEILDEWLRGTREGRAVVTVGWRDAHAGEVSEDTAHRANIWFRRYADADRDMTLTDPEIRRALVLAATPYLRRR